MLLKLLVVFEKNTIYYYLSEGKKFILARITRFYEAQKHCYKVAEKFRKRLQSKTT